MLNIPTIDLVALLWFFVFWAGYSVFAERRVGIRLSLVVAMRRFRREWFSQMLTRGNRIGDIAALTSLLNNATFFASTSILVLGGLVALLGTTQTAMDVVSDLPFTRKESELVWRIKIILLILVFVYAFFKFTWSQRQFNFCTILVGAAPSPTDRPEQHAEFIDMITNVATYSAENLNDGLRAYYFSMAVLTWFLHPWLLFPATVMVVYILYQREFHSRTLYALSRGQGK
ncbi:MAG: DUF599 domain-containing protein [Burkholderiales bacterium]